MPPRAARAGGWVLLACLLRSRFNASPASRRRLGKRRRPSRATGIHQGTPTSVPFPSFMYASCLYSDLTHFKYTYLLILFSVGSDGARCHGGRVLRPSGACLLAFHPLRIRALAQRPAVVRVAYRRIAVSHRPRIWWARLAWRMRMASF
jgi:hypothetical protein